MLGGVSFAIPHEGIETMCMNGGCQNPPTTRAVINFRLSADFCDPCADALARLGLFDRRTPEWLNVSAGTASASGNTRTARLLASLLGRLRTSTGAWSHTAARPVAGITSGIRPND